MRNLFKLALLSLILMIGCSKENELPTQTQESTKFYASIEVTDTRTYADENGKLLWTADDRIMVFKGNTYARQYRYTGQTGLNSGEFNDLTNPSSVITGNALSANYAVYPYDGSTSITNEGVINYTIPATQKYANNSFGLGANTMVAVTKNIDDNFLAFKNIGGYFEFSLYGDVTVKSIEFKGNNNEKLAGAVTITATNGGEPTVAFSNEATKTITLDCGASGIALGTNVANATKFWFVAPAIEYTNGITITITDTEGRVMTKSTSNKITISRSTVQPLHAFKVDTRDANTPPNNQIWYTSSDKLTVDPFSGYNTNPGFGANIINNVYENGEKGVITFNGDVTFIANWAFYNRDKLTSITIPNSVTKIGEYAFEDCENLQNINISNGVKTIGRNAFCKCSSLTSITIPDGVTSIDGSTFKGCTSLTEINIPNSVTEIGAYSFSDCKNLQNIIIPNNVKTIGEGAFLDCTSLTQIHIPNSVTTIKYDAFNGCANLQSIQFPNSVTTMGAGILWDCENLKSVSLPENITSIGNTFFQNCKSLSEITIPSKVSSIAYYAFKDCRSLSTIYCKNSTPPSLGNDVFLYCNAISKIYVPTASVDSYKSSDGWKNYADKIEGYNFSE